MTFDNPLNDDSEAVKFLLNADVPATKLGNFAMANDEIQEELVRNIGINIKIFRALKKHHEPAITALHKSIILGNS